MPATIDDAPPTDLITTGKAARIAHCCPSTIFRWTETGRLRAWMRGTRRLVSEADVRELLRPYSPPGADYKPRHSPARTRARSLKILREAGFNV